MWPLRPDARTEAFATYWDALVRGAPADELARLRERADPTLIAATERVRTDYRPRWVDPAFVARLEQDLMQAFTTAYAGLGPLPPDRTSPSSAAITFPPAPAHAPARRVNRSLGWLPNVISLAGLVALLVAVFAAIAFVYHGHQHAGILPAPQVTAIVSPSPAAEWLTLKGSAARTSAVDWAGPTGPLNVRWTFDAPGMISASAVSGDTVYVADQAGTLFALDTATGRQRWTFDTGAAYVDNVRIPAPTIAGSRVFLPGGDGTLYALDATSGAQAWSYAAGATAYASIAVVDTTAYFLNTKTVVALDTASGAVRWQQPIVGLDTRSQPAVADGKLVYGNDLGTLFALDSATGAMMWTAETGNALRTPTIADGRILIPSPSGSIVAVDAATGKELWRQQATGDSEFGSPAVIGGKVFTTMSSEVIAYDLASGTVLWRTKNLAAGVPAVAGGTVYVVTSMGGVVLLDLATGTEISRVAVPSTGTNSLLAITQDTVYVSAVQTLTALGVAT